MTERSSVDDILKKHGVDTDVIEITQDGKTYQLSEGRLKELTAQFVELLQKDAIEADDFGIHAKTTSLLLDVKRTWFPATQKSLHANVKDFDKSLEKWYVLQQELKKKAKEQEDEVEVYEIVDTNGSK